MDKEHLKTHSMSERLIYITLFQLWWVAVWGISYLFIENISKGSKIVELYIYIALLVFIFVILYKHPKLMIHL